MFGCKIGDIELRPFEERHANEIFATVNRNREHLRRYLPWVDRTRSPADVRLFLESAVAALVRGEELNAGIWAGKKLVGAIGHHRIDAVNRSASIGYWLAESAQGKGVMTRCCRAMVDYLFGERRLHRVEIRCAVTNTRSCAIPARLGFTREGVLRQAEWVNDAFLDLVVWSLLEDEWERLPHVQ